MENLYANTAKVNVFVVTPMMLAACNDAFANVVQAMVRTESFLKTISSNMNPQLPLTAMKIATYMKATRNLEILSTAFNKLHDVNSKVLAKTGPFSDVIEGKDDRETIIANAFRADIPRRSVTFKSNPVIVEIEHIGRRKHSSAHAAAKSFASYVVNAICNAKLR